MALICPYVELTWYPGAWPSVAAPLVLLGASHKLRDRSPLNGGVEQLVQRADYVRGAVPDFWARGNVTTPLEWTEVRRIEDPGTALATALSLAESLPTATGWLKVVLPTAEREYGVAPALIRGLRWQHDPLRGLLDLTWQVETGAVWEMAVSAPDGALTTETGWALVTEEGEIMNYEV